MNLLKQVEPLLSVALQASSKQRRAQRATSRLTWELRWLRRASDNHHEQSRSLGDLTGPAVTGSRKDEPLRCCNLREYFVDDALEPYGAFVEIARRRRLLSALAEELVGDVQRNEYG
jgi:hypothetical protein